MGNLDRKQTTESLYTSMDGMNIDGIEEVIKGLSDIADKGIKKAAKQGINAALNTLAKSLRQAVNGTSLGGEAKAEARKAVGKRLKKKEGQEDYSGKVGFGVAQSKSKRQAAKARASDATKKGVGLSGGDIHWFVLGTAERHTAKRATGKMGADPVLSSAMEKMLADAPKAIEAMAAKVKKTLADEAK
jgi:hypothetical protein